MDDLVLKFWQGWEIFLFFRNVQTGMGTFCGDQGSFWEEGGGRSGWGMPLLQGQIQL
jgi:hypothetical protein